MELFLSHWICLTVILVLFFMWVYTLRSDNERFKKIIDDFNMGDFNKSDFGKSPMTNLKGGKKPTPRKYSPEMLDG
jgi:hypothetical protein